jgi:hypothetical protein
LDFGDDDLNLGDDVVEASSDAATQPETKKEDALDLGDDDFDLDLDF